SAVVQHIVYRPWYGRGRFPADDFGQAAADFGEAAYGFDAGDFQRRELLVRGALATGDDGTGMAHAFALGGGHTGDVGYHRLADIRLDVGRGLFLGGTADLADHHDRLGARILLEHRQDVDEAGAGNLV